MTNDASQRTAIVTGAARGIGLGIAERFTRDGYRVAVWDWNLAPLEKAKDFTPAHVEEVDVSDYDAVTKAFDSAVAALGHVDVMVNNAGVNGPCLPTWEYPLEDFHRVIGIDLMGVYYCCRAAIPHMRERNGGRIITVASLAGKEGIINIAPYCAAKHGVIGMTKAIAKEVADRNILINCITPGMVETDLMDEMTEEHIRTTKAKFPLGRFTTIKDCADMVAFIAGPDCSFTTGMTFDVSGGRATY